MSTQTPLTITKEKVLEAASKCSTAAATLKTLFPECFVTATLQHFSTKDRFATENGNRGLFSCETCQELGFKSRILAFSDSDYMGYKSGTFLWLNARDAGLSWQFLRTEGGNYLLIPTRKDS